MSEITATLTKKIGPLPAWGYAVIGGGLGLLFIMRKKSSGTQQAAVGTGTLPVQSIGSGAGGFDPGTTGSGTGIVTPVAGNTPTTTPTTPTTTPFAPGYTQDPLRPDWVLQQQAEAMQQPGNLLAPIFNQLGQTAFNAQYNYPITQPITPPVQSASNPYATAPNVVVPSVPQSITNLPGNVANAVAAPVYIGGPLNGQRLVPYVGGPLNGTYGPLT
jgi:hypothetical protein